MVRAFIFILLLYLAEHAFAISNHTKFEILQSLICQNLHDTKALQADTIIAWGEELEPLLRINKQYNDLFEIKYLVARTHAMRGDISLAIDKVQLMSEEAKQLNYDIGFALASQAIGETYIFSNMLHEAIPSYKAALDILQKHSDVDFLKKRLLILLLQASLLEDNLEESHLYLILFNNLFQTADENDPFYIYKPILNAFYNIKYGSLDVAEANLNKALKLSKLSQQSSRSVPYLLYITALYHEKAGNYEEAIKLYDQLANPDINGFSPIRQNEITLGNARVLVKMNRADEAYRLYQRINNIRDSLSAKSYSRQISRLHTDYQINTMELENQTRKNNLARLAIIIGACILIASLSLASYVRKGNEKLTKSKADLEKAKRQAEGSIRSKSMFLSNMSHEIRTPLNALSGFSSILTEDSIDNNTRLQCTEIIQQNSELLLKLINDVIDLSSLEFGKMQFKFRDCDAITLCRNVVEMVQAIKQTNAVIQFESPLEELILNTDDARLQQVLINLIINATKFTPSGCITLAVVLQSENIALFTVTDTGCGIPLEKQEKIFKRFEKLDEQDQGTGLGLSICQLIIKNIGGEIWIDPSYTQGSRFCFTHPTKRMEEYTT